ncbi:FecR domain-containing protein [Candidatus Omnitrophota bacterium]
MKKYSILILGIIFLISFFAVSGTVSAAEVKVISVSGNVEVTPPVSGRPEKPKVDMFLKEGTKIVTKAKSEIEVAFNDEATNVVKISQNTHVVIKLDAEDKIELIDGELFAVLKNLKKGETFQVRTPCAVCGARGTGWQMSTDGKATDVAVFDKKVYVQGLNKDGSVMEKKYWVKKGYERKIEKFQKPSRSERFPKERLEKIKNEVKIKKIDKKDIKRKLETRTLDTRLKTTDKTAIIQDRAAVTDKISTIKDRQDLIDKADTLEKREDITDRIEVMENRQDLIDKRTSIIDKKEDVREVNTDAIRDTTDIKRLKNIKKRPPKKKP